MEANLCACGCGAEVRPGRTWRKGHHFRASKYQRACALGQVRSRESRRGRLKRVTEQTRQGGIVSMALHPARWDDEWALLADGRLAEVDLLREQIDRYGYLEVSYTLHSDNPDPLLALDLACEGLAIEKHRKECAERLRESGFDDLSQGEIDDVILGWGSFDAFAA